MVIDVRTVPAGHSVVSQAADLAGYAAELPVLKERVACRAEIDRAGTTLYINFFFNGAFELECSRCLAPFAWPVSGNVRLTVKEQPGRHGPSGDDEPVDVYYDSRHLEIDLGSVLYEEIMTALPLKPLCNEACAGIKLIRSKSAPAGIDPRWEALRNLKNGK